MIAQEARELAQKHTIENDLDAILAQLSYEQIRFLIARIEAQTDAEACRAIGLSRNTMTHWSAENRERIKQALAVMATDGLVTALHIRRRSLAKAMAVKAAGLDSDDERLRQNVATEIIEWEMGKATQKQEVSGPGGSEFTVRYVNDWRNTPSPTPSGPKGDPPQ